MKAQKIAHLKTKAVKYCELCGQKHVRTLSIAMYEGTVEEIQSAKAILIERAKKPYTCRICESILAAVEFEKCM